MFIQQALADQQGRRGLWQNNPAKAPGLRRLSVEPDSYIHAKPGKEAKADEYWSQRGHLLLCVKPRLNTARTVAVFSEQRTVGSQWVPARPQDEGMDEKAWAKALAVWLNSTPGIISMLAVAAPKNLSRPDMSIDAMQRLRVPQLDDEQTSRLAAIFDELVDTEMLTLAKATSDPVREKLDAAVGDIVGMDDEALARLRHEIASEPSVRKPPSKRKTKTKKKTKKK